MVCLMVGHVVDREVEQSLSPTPTAPAPTNWPLDGSVNEVLRNSIYKQESNGSSSNEQDLLDERKLEVAVALSMLVGLLQVGSLWTDYYSLFVIESYNSPIHFCGILSAILHHVIWKFKGGLLIK